MIAENQYILLKWSLHQRIGFGPPHISWLYIRINDTFVEEIRVFVRKGASCTKTGTLYPCKKGIWKFVQVNLKLEHTA